MEPLLSDTTDNFELAAPAPRGKRGRRTFVPNDEQRRTVDLMGRMGCTHQQIALLLKIDPKTLRKHFRHDLDRAAIHANLEVTKSLFKMATARNSAAAAIFWAKTRCGFTTNGASSHAANRGVSHSSPKLFQPFLTEPVPLPDIVAYNNDGEPNARA